MKKSLLIFTTLTFLIFVSPKSINAQFALGDIAFTGYNSEGTGDEFSFVLLRNVTAGEQIAFTENGWLAAGGFRPGEQTCVLTFNGNYNCGAQIYISGVPFGARDESMGMAGILSGSALALSMSGDQVFAYDPANVPIAGDESGFVAAIHMNDVWDADATSANTSAKPSVFTDGVNSISISPEVDNAQYNCIVIAGDPTTVLAPAIWNSANWNTDDITPYVAPAPCTITCSAPPCNDPNLIATGVTPATICSGDSSSIVITGSLNDATMWVIYTGSCGGTLLGTTASSSFTINPTVNTTYFIRGEGGCVTPGSCSQANVIVFPLDDPTFNYSSPIFCTTDPNQTPTITLPGGTFTSTPAGLNIVAGTGEIDPGASTPNTYSVFYTTNGTCPNSDSTVITVTTGADATITAAGPFCTNDPPINLSAVDIGGVWLGPGITDTINGIFDPAIAGPGGHTISYTIGGSCGDMGLVVITVNAAPFITLTPFNPDTVCSLSSPITVPIATPTGGTYSGPGVSGSTFDPVTAGLGTHTITYSITLGGCTDSASTQITVETCVGIKDEIADQKFDIYPNPNKGEFTLKISAIATNTRITINDIVGNQVLIRSINSTSTLINLSNFSKGLYLIKLENEKGIVIKKMIVE